MSFRPLLSALVLAAFAAACSPPPPKAAADVPPVAVTTARVESTSLATSFEAGGVLVARTTAVVSSRVLAPILEVRVRPGDRVRKGQLLIQLDARESRARAAGSTAAIEAAQQTGHAAEAEARSAAAALTLARVTRDRISGLVAKGSATRQELDEADATLGMAEARVASARAHQDEAAAALTAARSSGEALDIAASYAEITAPFDGVVASRSADPGTVAQPGGPLLTIEDPSGLRLEARIDEARAAHIAVGQSAQVRVDSTESASAPWAHGQVFEVARVDAAAHSFLIKIDIDASAATAWRSGEFGRARFAGPSHQALTAPATAIVRRGQLTLVFVVSADGYARLRPVSIGQAVEDRVEVLSGLTAGEVLIAHAPATVVDGTRVASGPSGAGR